MSTRPPDDSTRPGVSIVIPTYNRTRLLPATIQSVLAQTTTDWELIVADDGSLPDTLAYLETLEADSRVRLIRLAHSGYPSVVRNAAIAIARAPLLAFLDSDDLWEPSKLERQIRMMRDEPECGWSYTAFTIVDVEGSPFASERHRRWIPNSGHIFDEAVRGTASIRVSTVIANTQIVRDIGAFDERIDCCEDYDLWMRLALQSAVCLVDEPLVKIRRHAENQQGHDGRFHVARDYSLRKIAQSVTGRKRALLGRERSRNASILARTFADHGHVRRSVAVLARSLPFSWRFPRWWASSLKTLFRACFLRRQPSDV